MSSIESACEATESKAEAIARAAKQVQRVARKLRDAARDGDHERITTALAEVSDVLTVMQAAAREIGQVWPFDEERLSRYLEDHYTEELIRVAASQGVNLNRLDDRLAAFPVVLQILPAKRALRVDKVRVTALRPSRVVTFLASRMKSGAKPQQFLETLYRAYRRVCSPGESGAKLADILDLLTIHPETRRTYGPAEFARDVFELDTSGLRKTKSGAMLALTGSTGVKRGEGFLVVDRDGMPKHYYAVQFKEEAE